MSGQLAKLIEPRQHFLAPRQFGKNADHIIAEIDKRESEPQPYSRARETDEKSLETKTHRHLT